MHSPFLVCSLSFYPFLSNNFPAITTKRIDVKMITAVLVIIEISGPMFPEASGNRACFMMSMPYVNGLSFANILRISGRSLTGYMAPDRKNIGMIIKFMITLKLS
jgi:hypothetical protein